MSYLPNLITKLGDLITFPFLDSNTPAYSACGVYIGVNKIYQSLILLLSRDLTDRSRVLITLFTNTFTPIKPSRKCYLRHNELVGRSRVGLHWSIESFTGIWQLPWKHQFYDMEHDTVHSSYRIYWKYHHKCHTWSYLHSFGVPGFLFLLRVCMAFFFYSMLPRFGLCFFCCFLICLFVTCWSFVSSLLHLTFEVFKNVQDSGYRCF